MESGQPLTALAKDVNNDAIDASCLVGNAISWNLHSADLDTSMLEGDDLYALASFWTNPLTEYGIYELEITAYSTGNPMVVSPIKSFEVVVCTVKSVGIVSSTVPTSTSKSSQFVIPFDDPSEMSVSLGSTLKANFKGTNNEVLDDSCLDLKWFLNHYAFGNQSVSSDIAGLVVFDDEAAPTSIIFPPL